MRLRRRKGTWDWLHGQRELVVLEPGNYKGTWSEYFGNTHPIHVELGMGKGQFVTEMSMKYPHVNFIGIDLYDELIRKAAEKAKQRWSQENPAEDDSDPGDGPPNLAVVLLNIEKISEVFATDEVERFYLNFSDPWPKHRHARRRLTHPRFIEQYRSILNTNGELHLKTDSSSLFEYSLNVFADMHLDMRHISLDVHREGTPPDHVMTEYEQKFAAQGLAIHRCEVLLGDAAVQKDRLRTQKRIEG